MFIIHGDITETIIWGLIALFLCIFGIGAVIDAVKQAVRKRRK